LAALDTAVSGSYEERPASATERRREALVNWSRYTSDLGRERREHGGQLFVGLSGDQANVRPHRVSGQGKPQAGSFDDASVDVSPHLAHGVVGVGTAGRAASPETLIHASGLR
jgi:hypothetical protein